MTDPDAPKPVIPPELRQQVPDTDPRDVRAVGFDQLSKAERQEMALRSQAVQRAKRQARQLANLEAYTEAHRDLASQILGAKMSLLDGLIDEMKGEDGKLHTENLDDKRMKLLMALMKQLEERAFGGIVTKAETHTTVDIRAAIVDLTRKLNG